MSAYYCTLVCTMTSMSSLEHSECAYNVLLFLRHHVQMMFSSFMPYAVMLNVEPIVLHPDVM